MTVYVVVIVDIEGFDVIGVYSDEFIAEKKALETMEDMAERNMDLDKYPMIVARDLDDIDKLGFA